MEKWYSIPLHSLTDTAHTKRLSISVIYIVSIKCDRRMKDKLRQRHTHTHRGGVGKGRKSKRNDGECKRWLERTGTECMQVHHINSIVAGSISLGEAKLNWIKCTHTRRAQSVFLVSHFIPPFRFDNDECTLQIRKSFVCWNTFCHLRTTQRNKCTVYRRRHRPLPASEMLCLQFSYLHFPCPSV